MIFLESKNVEFNLYFNKHYKKLKIQFFLYECNERKKN